MRNEDYINEETPQQFFAIIEHEFAQDHDKVVQDIRSLSFDLILLSLSKKDRIDVIKEASEIDERVSMILERVGVTSIAHLEQPQTAVACRLALAYDHRIACKILFVINNYLIARRDLREKLK
jgi:hypothetical protein